MSASISPASGRSYGVQFVCKSWEAPRSTFYARKAAQGPSRPTPDPRPPSPPTSGANDAVEAPACSAEMPSPSKAAVPPSASNSTQLTPNRISSIAPPRLRSGPKTAISDDDVLRLIREDLATTKFRGEGHRKVRHRIQRKAQTPIGTRRVLRLMREHHLLSPSRTPKGLPNLHDGHIITEDPNLIWATDGTRIWTEDEGFVWIFVAVEHWNTECMGFHVVKHGDRFEALEPIRMGLERIYGSTGPDAARGLKLRMDWGSQYRSEHFRAELKYWGITASYAFVGEPETNGVAERFMRTMKEQAVHGIDFRNVAELRAAIQQFVTWYNEEWLVEKLGHKTPNQARREFALQVAA